MDDLTQRLRDAPERKMLVRNGGLPSGNYPKHDLVEYVRADVAEREAAARIEALEAEVARLRGALEEIAEYDTGATAGLAYTARAAITMENQNEHSTHHLA